MKCDIGFLNFVFIYLYQGPFLALLESVSVLHNNFLRPFVMSFLHYIPFVFFFCVAGTMTT
jgi:hypothetical protein